MKKILLALALMIIPGVACAVPGKPSVSGTFESGSSITISGLSFGSKSAAPPLVWDTFEGGTNGTLIRNQNATVGDWDDGSGAEYPTYTTTRPRTGNLASAHIFRSGTTTSNLAKNATEFSTMYLDFWIYISPLTATYSRNFKPWRLWDNDGGIQIYEQIYCPDQSGSAVVEIYDSANGSNIANLWHGGDVHDTNVWKHYKVSVKQSGVSTADGTIIQELDGVVLSDTTQTMRVSSKTWTQLRLGHYWALDAAGDCASNTGADVYIDDVYIDTTFSRVEIGNASTYSASTHKEVLIPTAWASDGTSITATVNTGTFAAGDTVYLYVVDANGDVSPASDPIEVGGTATVTCYPDDDEDTYGDINDAGTSRETCNAGEVTNHTDCNDNNAAIHPGATETCGDSIDQDCSGADLACGMRISAGTMRVGVGSTRITPIQ